MRKALHIIVPIVMAALFSGCASTHAYLLDRASDAADMVTLTVGYGAGAKARVGPIQVGLFANRDVGGIRGGTIGYWDPFMAFGRADYDWLIIPAPDFGNEEFDHAKLQTPDRHKQFIAFKPLPFISVLSHARLGIAPVSREKFPYYTQIEAAVGLGPTIRAGCNPAEILDFLLGWFTIDLFNDDVELKRLQRPN